MAELTNSPSCIYCQGENIQGCYCVVRFTPIYPEPFDSHVKAYDMIYVYKLYKKAKENKDIGLQFAIKSGLNCYMLPFDELRRSLQRTEFLRVDL